MSVLRPTARLFQRLLEPMASARSAKPRRAELDRVEVIVQLSDALQGCDDAELRDKFWALSARANDNKGFDAVLNEAFACIREGSRRALSMPHYRVQLLAGLALVNGNVAEMATGEGKTLVATLPTCARALQAKPVHVMTVNSYLAQRDLELMRPVYELLGLTCGLTESGGEVAEKRAAYAADITYGTGAEFGFDYLRDQLALASEPSPHLGQRFTERLRGKNSSIEQVQRGFGFALVDEADSVMLDEANSALILSGSSGRPSPFPEVYQRAHARAESLEMDTDFTVDDRTGAVSLCDRGVSAVFGRDDNLRKLRLVRPWTRYVEQALRAIYVIKQDVDYVVVDDSIQIVDEYTGRRFEDRSWSEGLHQAVEASRGVTITEESGAMLRISRQRYLSFYDSLSGMTGTAEGCEKEFKDLFSMGVRSIPRRNPERRIDHGPTFYADRHTRDAGLCDRAIALANGGQPVLIGTRTVQDSEHVEAILTDLGFQPVVLNALQDEHEAEVIAGAGKPGQITIATNMAGRGSDIPLSDEALTAGGLAVLCREPSESPRVDRQLVGRAGRQGDPGVSYRYASGDDELFRRYAPELGKRIASDASGSNSSREDALNTLRDRLEAERSTQREALVRRDHWLNELLVKAS